MVIDVLIVVEFVLQLTDFYKNRKINVVIQFLLKKKRYL